MIAHKIEYGKNSAEHVNFRKLAEYIAAAKEQGEKLEHFWAVNAVSGEELENLDMIICEVGAQQALNTRVKASKQYHLIVSFKDEQPPLEALKDIELEYAKALGFQEHPRVIGTHSNTDNFHMHVGYSRIHPKTYRAHAPGNDFLALEKVSRAMEKKYGLKVDLGQSDKLKNIEEKNKQIPKRARDKEAVSWEESFHSYVQRQAPDMVSQLQTARNWKDVHQVTKEYGVKFQPRGDGMLVKNLYGPETVKASSLGREYAYRSMVGKLGMYELADLPIHHEPNFARDTLEINGKANEELGYSFEGFEDEALTFQDVLESNVAHYVEAHKEVLKQDILSSQSWQELHHKMKAYNLRFFERGNGMIIADTTNWQNNVKASEVDRALSKTNMLTALGPYEKMNHNYIAEATAKRHIHHIREMINKATSWQELHHQTKENDFVVRVQKNGLHLYDQESGQSYKLEQLDERLTNENLINKLGRYHRYDRNHGVYLLAKANQTKIREIVSQSPDWQSLHYDMHELGLQFRDQKNGLHLVDLKTGDAMKYEVVQDALDRKMLLDALGDYEKPVKDPALFDKVRFHAEDIQSILEMSVDWQSLHHSMRPLGLEFRESKYGLQLMDIQTRKTINASVINADYTSETFNKRFDKYEPYIHNRQFYEYVREQVPIIEDALEGSGNWQDFHRNIEETNLRFIRRKHGYAINQIGKPLGIWGTLVDQQYGVENLEGKFGKYEPYVKDLEFYRQVQGNIDQVLSSLHRAKNWDDFHVQLAEKGIHLSENFNQLYLKDIDSEQQFKATDLDKGFTIENLKSVYGEYKPHIHDQSFKEKIEELVEEKPRKHWLTKKENAPLSSWQDFHRAAKTAGLSLSSNNDRLQVTEADKEFADRQYVNLGQLSKDHSLEKLEERFGKYQPYVKSKDFLERIERNLPIFKSNLPHLKDWQQLHLNSAPVGILFREQKNGLHLVDRKTGEAVKVSDFSKAFDRMDLKTQQESDQSLDDDKPENKIKETGFNAAFDSSELKRQLGTYEPYISNQDFLKKAKASKDDILTIVGREKNWTGLHESMFELGFQFRGQRNGLHILDLESKDVIPASIIDPSLDSEKFKERLGEYERSKLARSKSYGKSPKFRHPALSPTFRRYLGHKKKDSLMTTAMKSWKDFLIADAMNDPMAMAIIVLQNKMLKDFENLALGKQQTNVFRP